MSGPLEYVEVLMAGKDSACHGEAYIVVSDGRSTERVMQSGAAQVFAERLHGFSRLHGDDHRIMVEKARNKGVMKWVAGREGNVIFDVLCVTEDARLEQAAAAKTAVKEAKAAAVQTAAKRANTAAVQTTVKQANAAPARAAAKQARTVQAPARMNRMNLVNREIAMVQPRVLAANPGGGPALPELQACKKKQPHYLRPATPGMTRQLASMKTRAFTNGGRMPGYGSCGNYCVSRLSSTNLSAIDIAKTLTLSQLR